MPEGSSVTRPDTFIVPGSSLRGLLFHIKTGLPGQHLVPNPLGEALPPGQILEVLSGFPAYKFLPSAGLNPVLYLV